MKKSKVRCWRIKTYRSGQGDPDILYIAYPEDDAGYELISCLNCGHVYSVSVSKEMYSGVERKERLRQLTCVECGRNLAETTHPYPEKYRAGDGSIVSFERPLELPPAEGSIVREFDEIYS